jgi:hypothetical protein
VRHRISLYIVSCVALLLTSAFILIAMSTRAAIEVFADMIVSCPKGIGERFSIIRSVEMRSRKLCVDEHKNARLKLSNVQFALDRGLVFKAVISRNSAQGGVTYPKR